MPPPLPLPPSPLRIALVIGGLLLVAGSLYIAFVQPFGIWHWLLLALAGGCLYASRRM